MLYFTSFGFGVVACLFKRRTWLKPMLIALMGTSILHHAKYQEKYRGKRVVALVDKALAHTVTLGAIHHHATLPEPSPHHVNAYYASCLAWILYVYNIGRLSYLPKPHGDMFHASIHIIACTALAVVGLRSNPK